MKSVNTLLRAASACAVCLCFANTTQAADTLPGDAAATTMPERQLQCQNACVRSNPSATLAAATNEAHTGPVEPAPQQPHASGSKSRDDVIADLVQARRDGTYVPASEIYPDSTLPAASPVR